MLLGSIWRILNAPPLCVTLIFGERQSAQGRGRRLWALDLRAEVEMLKAGATHRTSGTFSPAHGMHHVHEPDDDGTQPDAAHGAVHYTVVGRLPARHNIWDSAILV